MRKIKDQGLTMQIPLKFGVTTISEIYNDRWKIEMFFKALKQNLKVKTFVGISENSLYIRIWTPLGQSVE